jgi:hypothetical protein
LGPAFRLGKGEHADPCRRSPDGRRCLLRNPDSGQLPVTTEPTPSDQVRRGANPRTVGLIGSDPE